MPLRWVLCPVVTITRTNSENGSTWTERVPKVFTYTETGRGKPFQHTSVIDARDWCISLVRATNFTALNGDNTIINLFDVDFENTTDLLSMTPRNLGWNAARVTKLTQVLTNKGVDTTGLTIDTSLDTWLTRLCEFIASWGKPRRLII
jgi:hypothetical protein